MKIKGENLLLISVTLLTSLIFSLPHIYGFWQYRKNYWPLFASSSISHINEETYTYAPEVWHLLKGYWRGDPYIWEQRVGPSPYVSELLSIMPVAILALLTGSVANSFVLADFIFPSIMFFTIYYFLIKLKYNRFFAISATIGVVITPFISMVFPKIQSYGTLLTGSSSGPLFFIRTPHPQISTVFVFLALFLTALLFESKFKKINLIILWAIVIASATYSSFYVSSTVLLGTLFLLPFFVKKIRIKTMIIGLFTYFILVLPFVINAFEQRQMLTNFDFLSRFTFSKEIMFPIQIRYILFGLLFYMSARKSWLPKPFLAYIFAAALLIDFHQLIFKVNIQADHWISRILAPIATLTLFLIVDKFVPATRKILWLGAAVILIIIGFSRQQSWIEANKDELGGNIERKQLITEIVTKTKKDDVIGSFSSDLNKEISANTNRWLYISSGDRTWISTPEAKQRICYLGWLLNREGSEEKISEPISYFLALEVKNKEKIDNLTQDVESCIEKEKYKPIYKLDYIVIKSQDGKFKLLKIKI